LAGNDQSQRNAEYRNSDPPNNFHARAPSRQ
jgi:hypothetical protein